MVTCEVCGGESFEKHAGFMYCAVCQTQSQDYHEQEYDYHNHNINIIRQKKSPASKLRKKQKVLDEGVWTTWEAFNYILYGMTEEVKKFGVTNEFELMVFKLWAAYLRKCEAVFISKQGESLPKLGYNFKPRDARILYNVDVSPSTFKVKKPRKKIESKVSSGLNSSLSSQTKRSIALQKGKIIESDYLELLSSSMQSGTQLADETIESLGRSSDGDVTVDTSDENDSLIGDFKGMLRKKDFRMFKSSHKMEDLLKKYKDRCKRDIKFPGKNKLLCIIHLALLMTGSDIQLSDLLRFIREGHLSFSKVTHFFPKDVKLPKKDFCYIEVTSDSLMPTHLHQRKIAGQLACLLRIEKLPVADMDALVDRYCEELNLPEEIAELSKKVLDKCMPSSVVPRKKFLIPSYEAWAMASIIFVMKLSLGLNDRTEIFLSHLAREVNSSEAMNRSLFAFDDWQKYIECRKTVLADFHYPTIEQLNGSSFRSSEKFLEVMMKESKDEYRNERFVPYSKYYIEEKVLNGIKQTLSALSKPQNVNFFQFEPSLTPQVSYVKTILTNPDLNEKEAGKSFQRPSLFPAIVLQQCFRNCSLGFAFHPKSYFYVLKDNKENFLAKFGLDEKSQSVEANQEANILLECSSNYWTLRYSKTSSGQLGNFKEEVFEKTPKNFQWLMTECARMLEMNVRDVYDELLRLEEKFGPKEKGKTFSPKSSFNEIEKEAARGEEESKKDANVNCEKKEEERLAMDIHMEGLENFDTRGNADNKEGVESSEVRFAEVGREAPGEPTFQNHAHRTSGKDVDTAEIMEVIDSHR